MQQLLWIETLLKFSAGLVLVLAPQATIKLLGLPRSETSFWPRLLGAVLVGIAGALFLEGSRPGSLGLGLAGSAVVNLAGAAMMGTLLAMDAGPPSTRGRVLVWSLLALLLFLSILEMALV